MSTTFLSLLPDPHPQARQLEYRLGETPGQSEKASAELADVEAERTAEEQDATLDKVSGG